MWALEQPAAKEEDQVETLSVQKIGVGGRGMCGVPARTPWKAASLRVCAQVPVRRVARAWARSAHLALQLADHRYLVGVKCFVWPPFFVHQVRTLRLRGKVHLLAIEQEAHASSRLSRALRYWCRAPPSILTGFRSTPGFQTTPSKCRLPCQLLQLPCFPLLRFCSQRGGVRELLLASIADSLLEHARHAMCNCLLGVLVDPFAISALMTFIFHDATLCSFDQGSKPLFASNFLARTLQNDCVHHFP